MTNKSTIMIVTYNRLELTKKALHSLLQTAKDFNLVIVDNGSSDGTQDYINDFLDEHKLTAYFCRNADNLGIAVGRNQSLKITNETFPDTEFYCTMDNDVECPNGWLDECINILKSNRNYGAIGVNFEGVNYPLVTLNEHTFQNKPQGNLGTATMVFPKAVHKMLGFFNYLDYGVYGLEDSDWGMRVRVAGFKLGYLKDSGVHLGVGEHDVGEYRKFKTETHDKYLKKFNENCAAYAQRKKSIYIPYAGP